LRHVAELPAARVCGPLRESGEVAPEQVLRPVGDWLVVSCEVCPEGSTAIRCHTGAMSRLDMDLSRWCRQAAGRTARFEVSSTTFDI
jgi:hypothetical protein